ncbi:MAG: hypothetical protein AB1482_13490 [Pseudomonadota bacterium]
MASVKYPIFLKNDPPSPTAGSHVRDVREKGLAAVQRALERMASVAARPEFAHPESVTWDSIVDYALALIRVRDSAAAAGYERLTQACDALALTVSRLLDEHRCTSPDALLSLKRFVAHARAMLPLPALATPDAERVPITPRARRTPSAPDSRLMSVP